ncbi:hypothetical protein AOU32_004084 [Salmonella enterica subsp. enterica serovar Telhashomer]|nr:hypothetical protein [Salmonella enterica subsp. enterica serovar Telhashomer]EDW2059410.1 hypothetical protein [Salmonella enterica subsp. enterica serovar Oslo]
MGCRGSEVQILSCRPKFPLKASLPGLVFLYIQFANGEIAIEGHCKLTSSSLQREKLNR